MKVLSSIAGKKKKKKSAVFCTAQQNSNKAMSLKLQRGADFQSAAFTPLGYEKSACGLITPPRMKLTFFAYAPASTHLHTGEQCRCTSGAFTRMLAEFKT